jgi:hypothetical protein
VGSPTHHEQTEMAQQERRDVVPICELTYQVHISQLITNYVNLDPTETSEFGDLNVHFRSLMI